MSTATDFAAIWAAEGTRAAALATAIASANQKTGMSEPDAKAAVQFLVGGKTWAQTKALFPLVPDAILEGWKNEILRRQALPNQQERVTS
jgi:hypothetical protein